MPPIEIDPNFAGSGRAWKRRRRARLLKRAGVAVLGLGAIGGLVAIALALWPFGSDYRDGIDSAEGDELTLVQSEGAAEGGIVLAAAAAEAFLDIRGAPMIITLPDGPALGARRVSLEHQIHPQRARIGDQIEVIEDALFDATQRVQLTLPSSSADLAAFQARRETAIVDTATAIPDVVEAGSQVVFDDDEGSWGEVVGGDAGETQVSYVETIIENTTTEALSLSPSERQMLFRDEVIRLETDRDLKTVLSEQGVTQDETDRILSFVRRMADDMGVEPEVLTNLSTGGLVALRLEPGRAGAQLMQMSIYAPDRYLASLAQPGPGRFETSADPWFSRNLLRRADIAVRNRGAQGEVKLKDAIYSTALRNGVSSELVGELMVMLSRVQDLDRIATEGDRMRLILREEGAGVAPAGQILYVALDGPTENFECFVVRPNSRSAPFGCFDPQSGGSGGGGSGLGGSAFVIPVSGTKTSGFGPRHHPILNRTVNHNGVDWAAPTGTPVKAVAGGRISRANFSSSYGNIVYIDHPGGAHSRYAHLNAFAEGIDLGTNVQAGQIIGYVGTTGRSTGPHLHFELHLNGRPVDPLALGAARASGAVEALVAQIIRVESAGNARAKNTRSTATGLGQFIESTWLRMMRTYRPDLVATLNRAELLELRFDPALSRAMVTNLARENEAFLRTRGHQITPGRLYLAHFLGPAGADIALKANPEATVLEVMGASVVNANPFLRGKTVRWMTDWSDRKMNRVGRGGGGTQVAVTNAPAVTPAEVKRYKEGVAKLLQTL
ncbi:MAG: M23 family metallopeptidase [Pseudomonadota bacterium]